MGFLSKAWDVVKDIGAGILSGILGTLVHAVYIIAVRIGNAGKTRVRLSDCLKTVLNDANILSDKVNLNAVRFVSNAWGLRERADALTDGNTIYFKRALSEQNNIGLILHELKHVEQYELLGYVGFVIRYDFQMVRYGYEDAPLEKSAQKFESDHRSDIRREFEEQCIPKPDPDNPDDIRSPRSNEDWTMLLDLI